MLHKSLVKDLGIPALFTGGLIAVLFAIVNFNGGIPLYWNRLTAIDTFSWIALCSVLYIVTGKLFPRYNKLILVLFSAVYIAVGVGTENLIAVLIFLTSSLLLGQLILSFTTAQENIQRYTSPAVLLGTSCFVAIFGYLIHTHANKQEIYWVIIGAPLLRLFSHQAQQNLVAAARALIARKVNALTQMPGLYFFIAIIIFTTVARYTFFPSISYDDNALHLRMWSELRDTGTYSFDVKAQIWSVAPFTVDLLHAVTSLMADSDSRGAFDVTLFALLALSLNELAKLFISDRKDRLLLISLFCSTPIIANLLVTLQTELFMALVVTAGTLSIYLLRKNDIWPAVLGVIVAAALTCSIKVPGAVISAMLVIGLLVRMCTTEKPGRVSFNKKAVASIGVVLCIACFVAFHPYINAWRITHNPVFPLYNAIFKSEFYPLSNFVDPLYQKGFSLSSYVNTFFMTSQFFEANNFTAGFQYLIFLPVALLLGLFCKRRLVYLPLLVVTFGFGIIMFAATQYWRYLFPIVPIASVVIGFILSESGVTAGSKRYLRLVVLAVAAINLYLLPGVSWFFVTPLQSMYNAAGKQAAVAIFAPAKDLVSYINVANPRSKVVFDSASPYGATLNGHPVLPNWYSPLTAQKFSDLKTPADAATLFASEGIDFVAWSLIPSGRQTNRELIHEYLTDYGTPVYQAGTWVLYRVSPIPIDYKRTFDVVAAAPTKAPGTVATAEEQPNVVSTIATNGAAAARYTVSYTCGSASGYFVAQINWDKPPVYYKLLPCSTSKLSFSESVPVPLGSTKGDIYVTSRDIKSIAVQSIKVDLN
ncbi:hypothetical protein [Pseudomonas sp. TE3610]